MATLEALTHGQPPPGAGGAPSTWRYSYGVCDLGRVFEVVEWGGASAARAKEEEKQDAPTNS